MVGKSGPCYEFGPFRLDVSEHMLLRDGQHVPLTPKILDVLRVLVQNHGHLVEKESLLKEIWPDSFVEEGTLNRSVSVLRRALGDSPSGHQYVETVPKRGYRFVAPVVECLPLIQNPSSVAQPPCCRHRKAPSDSQSILKSVPRHCVSAPKAGGRDYRRAPDCRCDLVCGCGADRSEEECVGDRCSCAQAGHLHWKGRYSDALSRWQARRLCFCRNPRQTANGAGARRRTTARSFQCTRNRAHPLVT